MPIDLSLLPSLERELAHAKQVRPGGQAPSKDRIAAIEEQVALYRSFLKDSGQPAPEKGDASNASTDYESHDDPDAVAKAVEAERKAALDAEEAAKKSAKKSPTKRGADGEDLETATTTEATETA